LYSIPNPKSVQPPETVGSDGLGCDAADANPATNATAVSCIVSGRFVNVQLKQIQKTTETKFDFAAAKKLDKLKLQKQKNRKGLS
jgi:hypothetical protein